MPYTQKPPFGGGFCGLARDFDAPGFQGLSEAWFRLFEILFSGLLCGLPIGYPILGGLSAEAVAVLDDALDDVSDLELVALDILAHPADLDIYLLYHFRTYDIARVFVEVLQRRGGDIFARVGVLQHFVVHDPLAQCVQMHLVVEPVCDVEDAAALHVVYDRVGFARTARPWRTVENCERDRHAPDVFDPACDCVVGCLSVELAHHGVSV